MDQINYLLAQLRRQPNRPDLHNSLGRLYQQRGDVGDASKHYLAAAKIFSTPDSPSRNLNKAIAILRKMVRDFPIHHDSYYLLAEILGEMDNQDEVIEIYSALSEIYRKEGKHLMAVSVFDKVISSIPDDQNVWIRFANLNRDAGMPFHAAQAFVRAASIGLETRKGELPAGLVLEALRLDPENAEARELIKTLAGRGQTGAQQEEGILLLAEEIDRGGQFEAALDLLDLLKGTSVQDRAKEMALLIRRHSGIDDSYQDGQIVRSPEVSRFAGMKVLVVDDEPEIVLLLEQILDSEGFSVLTARDGQEGLNIYLRERPPLVVSDAMLPKLHGFELCARIKEESDYTARVMILTAVYKKYKYKGKVQAEYHVDEYLDKPFQITDFLQVFRKMAEGAVEYTGPGTGEEEKPVQPSTGELTVLVGSGMDAELSAKVTAFCERRSFKPVITHDYRAFFDHLKKDAPDILLIRDDMPGIDPFMAGHIVRSCMDLDHMTMVLVARDRSRLDVPQVEFDHRVVAPIDNKVLDNIINLHRSARGQQEKTVVREAGVDESRIESLVRSKVAQILKSHNQLEEYYSTKVRELEEELRQLKEKGGAEVVGGEGVPDETGGSAGEVKAGEE
ncbi:MAG: response regulator [bacterium]|nr:response regulator [bacterium]